MNIDDLVAELDDARTIAKSNNKPSAMISATMSKAKLLGFDTGIQHDDEVQPVKVVIQVEDARKHDNVLMN